MRKGLVIFGTLVAAGVAGIIAYRKHKKSEEEDLAKTIAKTIKDKVDEATVEKDIKDMIDKKAKRIVDQISLEKSIVRFADRMTDKIIFKAKRAIEKKVAHYMFWAEWLE